MSDPVALLLSVVFLGLIALLSLTLWYARDLNERVKRLEKPKPLVLRTDDGRVLWSGTIQYKDQEP